MPADVADPLRLHGSHHHSVAGALRLPNEPATPARSSLRLGQTVSTGGELGGVGDPSVKLARVRASRVTPSMERTPSEAGESVAGSTDGSELRF